MEDEADVESTSIALKVKGKAAGSPGASGHGSVMSQQVQSVFSLITDASLGNAFKCHPSKRSLGRDWQGGWGHDLPWVTREVTAKFGSRGPATLGVLTGV